MKKVLLVTDGVFHPPFLARKALRSALSELDGFHFEHIRSMEKLPDNLGTFSAMVLYFHHAKISEGALVKVDKFVSDGGGVFGIHSATASFKDEKRYFEILGGRFAGHGPVESFMVEGLESDIFGDIDDFIVKDELYLHETTTGIDIHFTAKYEGEKIPVVWTYSYGNGRVVYAVPGHTAETLKNKTYQKLLQQGLKWVTSE